MIVRSIVHCQTTFVYGTLTLYGCPFQVPSTSVLTLPDTGLVRVRSPLLTESQGPEIRSQTSDIGRIRHPISEIRNPNPHAKQRVLFSLPLGTKMFQFPRFPTVLGTAFWHSARRVSPFGHPRINACLPASRGFSQAATSFIGFFSQGIHHTPVDYPENRTSSLCSQAPTKNEK